MRPDISIKTLFIIAINLISFTYIIYNYHPIIPSRVLQCYRRNKQYSLLIDNERAGWISSSLYNELHSYITFTK